MKPRQNPNASPQLPPLDTAFSKMKTRRQNIWQTFLVCALAVNTTMAQEAQMNQGRGNNLQTKVNQQVQHGEGVLDENHRDLGFFVTRNRSRRSRGRGARANRSRNSAASPPTGPTLPKIDRDRDPLEEGGWTRKRVDMIRPSSLGPPTSAAPTVAPVATTSAPITRQPTVSNTTVAPSVNMNVTTAPTSTATTSAPTVAGAAVTAAPTIAGATNAPSMAATTVAPTIAEVTIAPTMPGAADGTAAPTIAGATNAPTAVAGGETVAPTSVAELGVDGLFPDVTEAPTAVGATNAPTVAEAADGTGAPTVPGVTNAPTVVGAAADGTAVPTIAGATNAPTVAGAAIDGTTAPTILGATNAPTALADIDLEDILGGAVDLVGEGDDILGPGDDGDVALDALVIDVSPRSDAGSNMVPCVGDGAQDIAFGIDVQVKFPDNHFQACTAQQFGAVASILQTTLNVAFPNNVPAWSGEVDFHAFEFDVSQFTLHINPYASAAAASSNNKNRNLLRSKDASTETDYFATTVNTDSRRRLQESACPTRPTLCQDTTDVCLFGCGIASVATCDDATLWDNLSTSLSMALMAQALPCLGGEEPPVVLLTPLAI